MQSNTSDDYSKLIPGTVVSLPGIGVGSDPDPLPDPVSDPGPVGIPPP